MDKFYNKIISELEIAVNELEIKGDCTIQRIEAIIQLIIKSLSDLKEFVLKNDFKDLEAEIYFFKYQNLLLFRSSFTIMLFIKSNQSESTTSGEQNIRDYS